MTGPSLGYDTFIHARSDGETTGTERGKAFSAVPEFWFSGKEEEKVSVANTS